MKKMFVVLQETWDHQFPSHAGGYSEDGDWQSSEVVKIFNNKENAEGLRAEMLAKYGFSAAADHGDWLNIDIPRRGDTEHIISIEEVEVGD